MNHQNLATTDHNINRSLTSIKSIIQIHQSMIDLIDVSDQLVVMTDPLKWTIWLMWDCSIDMVSTIELRDNSQCDQLNPSVVPSRTHELESLDDSLNRRRSASIDLRTQLTRGSKGSFDLIDVSDWWIWLIDLIDEFEQIHVSDCDDLFASIWLNIVIWIIWGSFNFHLWKSANEEQKGYNRIWTNDLSSCHRLLYHWAMHPCWTLCET
jgi:hypothetical protein